ncbi:MAG TPA: sn-glycerol-3-phosphate ABC transporter ATP-binding protein UgpC [Firmicutes bacterium]|nr:sn-glycerol-3-phosphate ABC transporter ATP-binding protein UgpC [Bacillota bacterium]
MSGLLLKNINKIYPGGNQAVFNFCLDIRDKEFIVFVGPSGCGKSTTLRMIAGLEEISSGELYIDGKLVNDVVPKDRDIAMVFQNYALYPHMSVYDNMAFGLKLRKVPKDVIDEKVKAAAEILGITDYLSRKPKALSGGQRQRVALGRTIVREPKVFLLDEPLSNLDAKLRAQMRTEISKLHVRLATTFIYVTHDQIEAMTMGTRIVVMKDGFMQQVDTPQNLYDYPINLFVAGFIGTPQMNFFKNSTITEENGKIYVNFIGGNKILLPKSMVVKIKNLDEYKNTGKVVTLGVRPEDIHEDQAFISTSPDTVVKARIDVIEKLGAETQIYCDLDFENDKNTIVDNAAQMIAKISSRSPVELGEVVELAFDAKHIHLFDGYTESTMLERDEHYEVIPENAEGAAFVPPTPQEMQAQIDAARVVTKEMKKQAKRDARMEARRQASLAAAEAAAEEPAAQPAPAEAPAEVKEEPAPAAEVKEEKAEEKPAAKKPSAPKKK